MRDTHLSSSDSTVPSRASSGWILENSDEFWREYAEPVDLFVTAAWLFQRAFLSAARMTNPEAGDEAGRGLPPGTSALNAMVPPVGSALLQMRHVRFEQRQVSPSLLGSLVMMAQQDLAADRRIIRCHNDRCRLMVVAVGYQTLYCSEQCRYAAEKRPYRARRKAGCAFRSP